MLPVPAKVTLVNVANDTVTLEWDVGTSDNNMCEPHDIEVDCHPYAGFNLHSAGWSPTTMRLSRLRPYTDYTCRLVAINEAGRSNPINVTFKTAEGGLWLW